MFVVDTNVLVYAADGHSPFHDRCRSLLQTWTNQPSAWFSTWPILYEFSRIATHPRVFRSPWLLSQALTFVNEVRMSPGFKILTPTDRHADVLAEVAASLPHLAGNIIHDTHTAVLMREHGIRRIYTLDTDFHRFPFVEPIDPRL